MLKFLFEHPHDARYWDLKLVRHHPDGQKHWSERVRLIDDADGRVVVLGNGQEIVRLKTDDGRQIDLLFGAIDDREFDPVIAFLEGYEP